MRSLPLLLVIAGMLLSAGGPRPASALAQPDATVRDGAAVYPGLDVNVVDGNGWARLHLAFEVLCVDQDSAQKVASPAAREAIILFFRDKTVADVLSPKGKRKLKQDLTAAINKAVGGPRAAVIYFTQFIIL
ncbi:MAG: flagellar basal body-associated FliL family protein [Solidesulfovibrio sp.]